MSEHLDLQMTEHVAHITLQRPDVLNALSPQLLSEIIDACREIDAAPDVRVVVLRGEGRSFCAGADLPEFVQAMRAPEVRHPKQTANLGHAAAAALEALEAPVIAQIHGHCIGGGLVLAAACDLRLCAENSIFIIPEVDLGIPLAWGGVARLLREMGPALVKELVMTCRPVMTEEMMRTGFLNGVHPAAELDAAVRKLALQLAVKPRAAVRATKAHVNAITSQMVAMPSAVHDADKLVSALSDSDVRAILTEYMLARQMKVPDAE